MGRDVARYVSTMECDLWNGGLVRLVLFDIDSTLLHDGGAAGRAYNHAFEELFGMLPAHVDKHGKTDPNITREIALATLGRELNCDEEKRLSTRYSELFPSYLAESNSFSVLEGAVELCTKLSIDPSISLGIQTGNLEICAAAKLRRAALERFFRFGGYGSDSSDRTVIIREAIKRATALIGAADAVIVIGDSVHDIRAGNRNGAFTIGVATGKNSAAELSAAGAGAVVDDLTEASGIGEILKAASA